MANPKIADIVVRTPTKDGSKPINHNIGALWLNEGRDGEYPSPSFGLREKVGEGEYVTWKAKSITFVLDGKEKTIGIDKDKKQYVNFYMKDDARFVVGSTTETVANIADEDYEDDLGDM